MKPYNKQIARKLRGALTSCETMVWRNIRSRQINGYKFRRQHPIGPYVVDFYCDKLKLIIEIDGDVHAFPEKILHDKNREIYLKQLGYSIFRVTNDDIKNNIRGVLEKLYDLTLTLS